MRMRIRLAAVLTAVVAAVGVGVTGQSASAVTIAQIAGGFDPGDIISDQVMFNPSTMNAGEVQGFLNRMVPTCRSGYTCLKDYRTDTSTIGADPMCSTYTGAKNEAASTIIAKVAQACDVNPQVLLVTLEKEQGLVTDSWPDSSQYRKATGYACPDSSPVCDATYNGLFNQVYKAAWAFRRYTTPAGTTGPGWTSFNWFPVGKPSGILYNPNVFCGAQTVTIKNKATASLYYYTPYVPNTKALGAGFGLGDSCSAYGNRNFYLYFTTWFGSTHYTAVGAIGTYWTNHGGATGALGSPTGNQWPAKAADGSTGLGQGFQYGTVFSSKLGTWAVLGTARLAYYAASGSTGALGWPSGDQSTVGANGGGLAQSFAGGRLYLGPTGAYPVTGALAAAYSAAGGPSGALGWPTAKAATSTAGGGGVSQAFQSGTLAGANGKAAHALSGTLGTTWAAGGGAAGVLGWPIEDQSAVQVGSASMPRQRFAGGALYGTSGGVIAVTGALYAGYEANGDLTGGWGQPTSATIPQKDGGAIQVFTAGHVYSGGGHVVLLNGDVLTEFWHQHGLVGPLGWPVSGRVSQTAKPTGGYWNFTKGRIYSSSVGTFAVRWPIADKYRQGAGPRSVLGWPVADLTWKDGVATQRFQHGTITWSSKTGAVLHH